MTLLNILGALGLLLESLLILGVVGWLDRRERKKIREATRGRAH